MYQQFLSAFGKSHSNLQCKCLAEGLLIVSLYGRKGRPREVSKFLKVTVSESEHKLGNLSHTKRGSGILSQKVYVGCGL